MRMKDPGANLTPEQAKVERLKDWKRPKTKTTREKRRRERIDAAKEVYGIADAGTVES